MKRIIIALLGLAAALSAGAQSFDVMDAGSAFLRWGERPLNATDFSPRINPDKEGNSSAICLSWNLKNEQIKKKNLSYVHPVYSIVFDRQRSWAIKDSLKTWDLRFFQLLFDTNELYRRRAQNAIDRNPHVSLDNLFSGLESSVERIKDETDSGKDSVALARFEAEIAAVLDTTSTESKFPVLGPYSFGLGYYFGVLQPVFINQGASEILGIDIPGGISIGLRLMFGRSAFTMDLTGNFGSLAKPIDFCGRSWGAGHRYSLSSINLLYSYDVLDKDWLDILPFAGVGISDFSMQDRSLPEDERQYDRRGLTLLAGADFRFKYARHYNAATGYLDSAIYARAFVARQTPVSLPAFYSINFGIGIDFNMGDR